MSMRSTQNHLTQFKVQVVLVVLVMFGWLRGVVFPLLIVLQQDLVNTEVSSNRWPQRSAKAVVAK